MPEISLEKSPQTVYGTLDPLGFNGRIGRMRMLAWTLVLTAIAGAVLIPSMLITHISYTLGITCSLTVMLAYLIISLRISAQRLHDLNWSAWMLLLHLVPVATLILSFMLVLMPGTTGPNQYGPPPPPNSTAVKVLAWVSITLAILSIIATILAFTLGLAASFINAASTKRL